MTKVFSTGIFSVVIGFKLGTEQQLLYSHVRQKEMEKITSSSVRLPF